MKKKQNKKEESKYQYRSDTAVRVEETEYSVNEYDEWDRIVFYLWKKSGYWSVNVFAPVTDGKRVSLEPLQVIHKYWTSYNKLSI